ncbi:MAG: tRNA (cytidine(34)-2'-O)-methyltransferase [Tissierellia bacterium]|jgi:tRNA (cytidine/uridine-2'-O-)-methyltransferase|nr:tRNA (cytidine(34)-2'-O)-methyltransferase [Tissierellia bacterium]
MLNVVFVEPEIPFNTGALVRTCGLTNSKLFIIKPMSFEMTDSKVKRAGLDYWELSNIELFDSFFDLYIKYKDNYNFFFATTKSKKRYTDVKYNDGDFLVFGRETKGLPKEILDLNPENNIRIPMLKNYGRSLNLANSANIILFEALRQINFPGLE